VTTFYTYPEHTPSTTSLDPPGAEMGNLVGGDEP
jgi:hypothetical protein